MSMKIEILIGGPIKSCVVAPKKWVKEKSKKYFENMKYVKWSFKIVFESFFIVFHVIVLMPSTLLRKGVWTYLTPFALN